MGALRSTQRTIWRSGPTSRFRWRDARRPWLMDLDPKPEPKPAPSTRIAQMERVEKRRTVAQRFAGFLAGLFRPRGRTA